MNSPRGRFALVTGATGFIGSLVVDQLLRDGWAVRTLSRSRDKALAQPWGNAIVPEGGPAGPGEVEIIEGDAAERCDLDRALDGIDCAWYLMHSMAHGSGFGGREQDMARNFGAAAKDKEVGRIVYLGGLHPSGPGLSEHLSSRVKVGEILMNSGVPTAALQAGVVIGAGSLSFALLRHCAERVPLFGAPGWITNEITPISARDIIYYLVAAADLAPEVNRTFDVGGPDTMKYVDMLGRYAKAMGLHYRPYLVAPIMTRRIASWGLGLLTPLSYDEIMPIFDSVSASTVVKERDLENKVGVPQGGNMGFEEAVRSAAEGVDAGRYGKIASTVHVAVLLAAAVGSLLTNTSGASYKRLRTPVWQPPSWVFPMVWTVLYTDLAVMSTLTIADAFERGEDKQGRGNAVALGVNLVLNVAWCALFFRTQRSALSTAVAGALAVSSADLVRRAHREKPQRAWWLAPYAAWCGFATLLNV
ncbi:tryptophan-rich sensory protein [Corynebacterium mayonis]|uniref:tryptophan-rich sensory protein n=1 Tax=Corynebacterium mayonis TaxID=3062461 RepID=UPI00314087E5